MTEQEVNEIVSYCREHGVSYKFRTEQLGIPVRRFYDKKRRLVSKRRPNGSEGAPGTGFIQLFPTTTAPAPAFTPSAETAAFVSSPSVEIVSPSGAHARITGLTDTKALMAVVSAICHVQP